VSNAAFITTKRPSLKLKNRTKQLFVSLSLPLAMAFPTQTL
jgi:hypothetical protein